MAYIKLKVSIAWWVKPALYGARLTSYIRPKLGDAWISAIVDRGIYFTPE